MATDLLYKVDKTRKDIECLLAEHKNLVYYILGETGQLSNPDAESAAWEALWDAVETFDVFSKSAFSTYACKVMKNAVYMVLRKEQTNKVKFINHIEELTEDIENLVSLPEESSNEADVLCGKFEEYIRTRNGLVRNIMLVWYASMFEMDANKIATICNCSPSYVGRVQRDFRAFVASI